MSIKTRTSGIIVDINVEPAAGAYSGPGDVIAGAAGWWGLRAYDSSARGSNCVRLVRASDSAEQDFITLSDGSVDLASITTFLNATTGKVVTLYDQSGNNRHLTQATDSKRPAFTFNAIGSLPGITFNSANVTSLRYAGGDITQAQPFTYVATFNRTAGANNVMLSMDNAEIDLAGGGADTVTIYAGTAGVGINPVTDNNFHSGCGIINGASSFVSVDGTEGATGNAGANTAASANLAMGTFGNGTSLPWDGIITEGGFWFSAFTTTQAHNINSNQKTYWGYP